MSLVKQLKKLVSVEEREAKMQICRACPEFYHDSRIKASRCRKCGCVMEAKTWIPGQHCPLKKW